MSNYTKTVNFAAKDSLASGDAAKIVKGTEIDTEFNNIATAVATKADSGVITDGTVTTAKIADTAVTTAKIADDAVTGAKLANDITIAGGLVVTGDLTVDTNTLKIDSTNNRVGILNASPDVSLDIGSATDSLHVPSGTTAQRPGSPAAGYFRYNSTTGKFEGYTDSWGDIGGGEAQFTLDTMTGDGSDTTLTMSVTPASENSIQVYFDGVYQHKDTFSFSGTTLTFSTAPASGVAVEVIIISTVSASTTPGDGTVTTAKLAGDAVTQAKIADDAVGADQLAASAVVTASIVDDAVTAAKLASDAVVTASMVDDAVTSAKLANSITMTGALAAAQVDGGVTTTVVSSNATATTGQNHFISSACTLTLPASPSLGDRVMVAVGNFATAILGRNSEKIEGTAEDMTIDVARVGLTCVYTGSTYGWAIY
tara:strand:- start:1158 stop:2435 length:1278 start_codon:yes stop_codon:yes gene_type:complete